MSWSYVLLVGPVELEDSDRWPAMVAGAKRLAQIEADKHRITLAEPERTGVRELAQGDNLPSVSWVEYTFQQTAEPLVQERMTDPGAASVAPAVGTQEELG